MAEVDHFGRFDAGWKIEGAFVELEFRGVDGGVLTEVREGYKGDRLLCYIVYGDNQGNPLKKPLAREFIRTFKGQVEPNMATIGIKDLAISVVREHRLPRLYQWAQQEGIELV